VQKNAWFKAGQNKRENVYSGLYDCTPLEGLSAMGWFVLSWQLNDLLRSPIVVPHFTQDKSSCCEKCNN
jgi:hypothetical protein